MEHPTVEPALTWGQRLADWVASVVGSWPFIVLQTLLLAAWIALNLWLARHRADAAFDPYPFILLNLVLSFQAAYTGPVVMMSQNRQADKDRRTAQHDLEVDRLAEREIRVLMEHLVHQDAIIYQTLDAARARSEHAEEAFLAARLDDLTARLDRSEVLLGRVLALLQGHAHDEGASQRSVDSPLSPGADIQHE
jgi:uncharacterized membrane protein